MKMETLYLRVLFRQFQGPEDLDLQIADSRLVLVRGLSCLTQSSEPSSFISSHVLQKKIGSILIIVSSFIGFDCNEAIWPGEYP